MAMASGPDVISSEEYAYQEIRERILDGRLPPGTRLPHKSLARELSVSSVPVYLAIRILEREGLVVNIPGFGAYVRKLMGEDVVNLFLMRALIEGLAARLCAENASQADLAAILNSATECKQAIERRELEMRIKWDIEFHRTIILASCCPDLQRMSDSPPLLEYSMRAFGVANESPPNMLQNAACHDDIVQAIMRRDADAAEREARKHVETSLAEKVEWIDKMCVEVKDSQTPRFRQPRQRMKE